MTSSSHLSAFGEFNKELEDWESYIERFDQYVIANDVSGAKKAAVLLSNMGSATFGLLKKLCLPEKPKDLTFDNINELLSAHLSPKPLVIAERFRFHKRDQQMNESLRDYAVALKKLSEHCNFDEHLDEVMRDRFVCGINLKFIQKRLLTEDANNLTFEKALNIAVAMEEADKDTQQLNGRDEATTLPPIGFYHFSNFKINDY